MSRGKKVFSKEQLAHLWANGGLDFPHDSRTPTGNLFTRGVHVTGQNEPDSAIWSYGSHYCLARMTRSRKGAAVVLFNRNSYSATTQRQRHIVRHALPSHAYAGGFFEVEKPQASSKREHMENVADYKERYESAVKAAAKPRIRPDTRAVNLAFSERLLDEANRYIAAFALGRKLKRASVEQIAARVARETKAAAKLRAESEARYREQHAAELAEYAAAVAEWKRAERSTDNLPHNYNAPVALRLVGDSVESSRGAVFPAEHAAAIWPLIKAARSAGRDFEPGGLRSHMLGAFPLRRVTAVGDVVAGCHTVPFAECAEMAAALGLEA